MSIGWKFNSRDSAFDDFSFEAAGYLWSQIIKKYTWLAYILENITEKRKQPLKFHQLGVDKTFLIKKDYK